ncbi:MAG: DUF3267 domain-containing protein [Chloroflexi bacterium]|nr:DUF3267 domain-containing protein [Chloroflexota bacterium]
MPTAPPGYGFAADLFGDLESASPWRFLLLANLLALIPLGAAALLLWLPYQMYAALGAPLALFPAPDWPPWGFWLFGAGALAGSIAAHEGLHGAALLLMGRRPRFGYAAGYLYASVRPGQFLTRRAYLVMVLSPLAIISLVGGLTLPFLSASLGQIVVLALLLNAAASIGDLAVAQRLLRWPPDALFAEAGGIHVYTRQG